MCRFLAFIARKLSNVINAESKVFEIFIIVISMASFSLCAATQNKTKVFVDRIGNAQSTDFCQFSLLEKIKLIFEATNPMEEIYHK